MKKIIFLFLPIFVISAGIAYADIGNGGFENDLNGWNLITGIASAVEAYSSSDTPLSLSPLEGSYFLELESGGLLSEGFGNLQQDVELNTGDVISGWLAFEIAGTSSARIGMEYSGSSETVWEASTGNDSWTYWSWIAPETNTYTLRFSAAATGIPYVPIYSRLFVDDITVDSASIPEPTTILLLLPGLGLLGMGAYLRKKKGL
jgi:hypothetical protein